MNSQQIIVGSGKFLKTNRTGKIFYIDYAQKDKYFRAVFHNELETCMIIPLEKTKWGFHEIREESFMINKHEADDIKLMIAEREVKCAQ